jgi:hypothetical protein
MSCESSLCGCCTTAPESNSLACVVVAVAVDVFVTPLFVLYAVLSNAPLIAASLTSLQIKDIRLNELATVIEMVKL